MCAPPMRSPDPFLHTSYFEGGGERRHMDLFHGIASGSKKQDNSSQLPQPVQSDKEECKHAGFSFVSMY